MSTVETAVAFAESHVGDPYSWGGSGPHQWDCSGLTQAAYAAAGVSITRTTTSQYATTPHVPIGQIVRGDLVFFGSSPLLLHHVALYLGNGMLVHSPHSGGHVENISLTGWPDTWPSAGRPVPSTGATGAPTIDSAGFSIPNPLNIPGDVAGAAAGLVTDAITSALGGIWSAAKGGVIRYGVVGAGLAVAGLGLYRAVSARAKD